MWAQRLMPVSKTEGQGSGLQLGEVHSICLGSGNVRASYGSSDSCRMETGLEVLKDPPAKLLPRFKAYRARLQGQELRRAVIKEAGGRGTAGPSKQSLRPYQLSSCGGSSICLCPWLSTWVQQGDLKARPEWGQGYGYAAAFAGRTTWKNTGLRN